MNAKFALPLEPTLKDLRPMTEKDVTQVHELLNGYLSRFDLSPEFVSDEEVSHYFLGTKTRFSRLKMMKSLSTHMSFLKATR